MTGLEKKMPRPAFAGSPRGVLFHSKRRSKADMADCLLDHP